MTAIDQEVNRASKFATSTREGADLLYSVNPKIKLLFQQRYFNDIHYVWCASAWDSAAQPKYSVNRLLPPSSNPKDLYHEMLAASSRCDRHYDKFINVKAFYMKHARRETARGAMSAADYKDMAHQLKHTDFDLWKPLLYIVKSFKIDPIRLRIAPPEIRASAANEFIISDLTTSEFDVLEF